MEEANYIALAVPVFLGLVFLEWLADRRKGSPSFDLGDSVANLGCGVLSQVASVLSAGALVVAFGGLYTKLESFAPFPLGKGALAWLAALLGVDLAYYWWHRMSHQVNLLWAMHVVHHQSPRYNLTVALRQASFSVLIAWIVNLPLALLGVPFSLTVASVSINTLYQFWIHTRLIGKIGALESLLNTPSHHRVHHGINPKYIDKNYGGIFICWDKLFGTFQKEEEEPVYGITSPFSSLNPVWANLHYWLELAELSGRIARRRDKIKLWLMCPGWIPEGVAKPLKAAAGEVASPKTARYCALQLAAGILALLALYRLSGPWTHLAGWGAAIAATMLSIGWLMDRWPWGRAVEAARLAALAGSGLALGYFMPSSLSWWLCAGATAGAAGWAVSLRAPTSAEA